MKKNFKKAASKKGIANVEQEVWIVTPDNIFTKNLEEWKNNL